MIRVVLDTNVVVSALLSPLGFEDRVLKLALHGHVQLYISPPILAEYKRVLSSPKFDFSKPRVGGILLRIQRCAHTVRPMRTLTKCRHEEDNRFLECADVVGADFVITGNQRHFPARWKQTSIVTARGFLERAFSFSK
jgi:putative PIN family toxin of toxin-antitoxin system